MRPLFTVHAAEYLVGSHIERQFKKKAQGVDSVDGKTFTRQSSR